MRPIDKSKYSENKKAYKPYGDAKDDLIKAIGPFCSYCERNGFSSALDVEHIEDKKNNPTKEYDWDNFLLACKNCNSIKGNKKINFNEIVLPDRDNTFEVFVYLESGLIIVNPSIDSELRLKAEKLIDLIGLDRYPGHESYSNKDKRWSERKEIWELANRYLNKLKEARCDIETILDLASKSGFWSIWMNVFWEYKEIKKRLVTDFNGTRSEYFI